jgi:hypothetical protein
MIMPSLASKPSISDQQLVQRFIAFVVLVA